MLVKPFTAPTDSGIGWNVDYNITLQGEDVTYLNSNPDSFLAAKKIEDLEGLLKGRGFSLKVGAPDNDSEIELHSHKAEMHSTISPYLWGILKRNKKVDIEYEKDSGKAHFNISES